MILELSDLVRHWAADRHLFPLWDNAGSNAVGTWPHLYRPCSTVVGIFLPSVVDPRVQRHGGIWDAGWLVVAAGTLIYAFCLIRFLAAGGTPALFFTRHLRLLIGEEPARLVSSSEERR